MSPLQRALLDYLSTHVPDLSASSDSCSVRMETCAEVPRQPPEPILCPTCGAAAYRQTFTLLRPGQPATVRTQIVCQRVRRTRGSLRRTAACPVIVEDLAVEPEAALPEEPSPASPRDGSPPSGTRKRVPARGETRPPVPADPPPAEGGLTAKPPEVRVAPVKKRRPRTNARKLPLCACGCGQRVKEPGRILASRSCIGRYNAVPKRVVVEPSPPPREETDAFQTVKDLVRSIPRETRTEFCERLVTLVNQEEDLQQVLDQT